MNSSEYIDLNRTFSQISKDVDPSKDIEESSSQPKELEKNWAELINEKRVVILSEGAPVRQKKLEP